MSDAPICGDPIERREAAGARPGAYQVRADAVAAAGPLLRQLAAAIPALSGASRLGGVARNARAASIVDPDDAPSFRARAAGLRTWLRPRSIKNPVDHPELT